MPHISYAPHVAVIIHLDIYDTIISMNEMLVQAIFECTRHWFWPLAPSAAGRDRACSVLYRNVARDNVIYALSATQPEYIRPQTAHEWPQTATKMLFCLNSPRQALYPK